MSDYSATPVPQKLGINDGSRVAVVGAPDDVLDEVGRPRARPPRDVVVFYVTREAELERRFAELANTLAPAGGLWVAYPKKAARIETDLSFDTVQEIGLAGGLVDNKSCAIDDSWTAVRFVRRRADR